MLLVIPDFSDGHHYLSARRRASRSRYPEADAEQLKQRPKEINIGVDAQGRYVIDRNVFQFTTVSALAETPELGGGRRHRRRRHYQRPMPTPLTKSVSLA